MKLDSLRISLYGIDEESYEFITTVKKSYKMVKRNCINFLIKRNKENSKIKFGFNYIILKENYKNLPKVIDFIDEVNAEVKNGPGIDFLSLRDDFDTVTGISDERDHDKKYHLDGLLTEDNREELIELFKNFESDKRLQNLHIDYGYALHPIKLGVLGKKLTRITDDKMRKYGHTQLSVCVDLYGDVFLYREAGFLNRNGNEKFIIGRVDEKISFKQVIEKAIAEAEKGFWVTLGIKPTNPSTGFGYIKTENNIHKEVLDVFEFIEKPNLTWNTNLHVYSKSLIVGDAYSLIDKIKNQPDVYLDFFYDDEKGKMCKKINEIFQKPFGLPQALRNFHRSIFIDI
mgnify:CR=1 FL=1